MTELTIILPTWLVILIAAYMIMVVGLDMYRIHLQRKIKQLEELNNELILERLGGTGDE